MRFFVGLIVVILFTLLFPLSIFAEQQDKVVILPKNQTVNQNYFATGSSVDIEGTVNGDVYAGGGNVIMNGTVNGDVIAGGGQVTVRGTAQNVRVSGGQIVIDGTVNGNVTAVGGNITITSGSVVKGSVVAGGGEVSLLGPIGKTVSVATGQIIVGNSIGGDIWVNSQSVSLTPQAKITGNLTYVSGQNAQIATGATISGKTVHNYPPAEKHKQASKGFFATVAGIKITFSIVSFLVSIIVGLLLLGFTPVYVERVMEHITHHPWQSLLIGIIAWIIVPLISFILLITIVGIPFTILLFILTSILSFVGQILASLVIGQWIVERFSKKVQLALALVVGLVVIGIVSFIPILGWIFSSIVTAIGFGAALFMEKVYYTELRTKKLI